MQYFNVAIIATLVGLSQALPANVSPRDENAPLKRNPPTPTCYGGKDPLAETPITTDSINKCIQKLNLGTASWIHGVECGGRDWFAQGENWDSAKDCIQTCTGCLQTSAAEENDWGKCDIHTGFNAHCWVAYCEPGKVPCGNGDGSCC